MRPSTMHAMIREDVRRFTAGSAPSATLDTDGGTDSDTEGLPTALRLSLETWREHLRRAGGDVRQLVAPSGSLDWMAPALPGERQPSGA